MKAPSICMDQQSKMRQFVNLAEMEDQARSAMKTDAKGNADLDAELCDIVDRFNARMDAEGFPACKLISRGAYQ